jgi:predicted nucleic acid-binding protein
VILTDSSIWIDHLRSENPLLRALLDDGRIVGHPLVTGEVAMGSLRRRQDVMEMLDDLPQATEADHGEVRLLIERTELFGRGIGYLDSHLLASTQLMPGAKLWTRDRRLHDAALRLGIAFHSDQFH